MNTNLIIQNAIRESTKQEKGGYIIAELDNTSPNYPVSIYGVSGGSHIYILYPGINYIYVPIKQIYFNTIRDTCRSVTYINFDLVSYIQYPPSEIVSFINCKKLHSPVPYVVDPHNHPIICNNNALINLYKEKCADPDNMQYTSNICLESTNCILDKTKIIGLYDTRFTDIYIGDCITTAKQIWDQRTKINEGIKRIHIDKFDKDNIKLNLTNTACNGIIIIDDSTRKKYKPIYDTNKTYFAEIVNGTFLFPFHVKLTFTANTDTSVKVYFTKESFDAKNPDDMISLTANQEKTTTYDKKNIYTFKFNDPSYIISAKIEGILLNCVQLLEDCSKLTTLDISKLDTSKVTDISNMFRSCSNLTTIDVSNLNVSNVTNMYGMFIGCSNLTTLEGLSKFNTSKVTNMNSMFYGCSKLSTIGPVDTASGWQHTPTDYAKMFFNCPATPKPSWYKS